jgi:hypothetical protein
VGPISPPSGSSAHGKEKEKRRKRKRKNIFSSLIIFLRKFSGDPPYAKKECKSKFA